MITFKYYEEDLAGEVVVSSPRVQRVSLSTKF